MKDKLKTLMPHAIAVLVFVLISVVYFSPVLDGKRLVQSDYKHYKGMSKEIMDHRTMFDEDPLWTNSMFGGMPAYQIAVKYPGDVLRAIDNAFRLWIPRPVNFVFLYMIGFYILMMALRVNPWLAIGGAIAFAFSSYFFVILEAGHNTKAVAIGYMAPTLAGIIWAYRGKLLLGASLTGLFMALQIHANHVQITYYFGFLVLFVAVALLIDAIKEKKLAYWLKTSALLVVMVVLAVMCNFANLYNTWEYGKFTTRGATDLTILPDGSSNENIATKGLDRDYVTQWSYGIGESLTFLIPNAKGGSTGLIGEDNSHLRQAGAQFRKNVAQSNQYWGDQIYTAGPVYFGALVFYLFILGLVLLPGNLRWALLATAVLTTMLSWGSNYMGLTDFFLDVVPGYDKFRAVTIILSITALTVPILAFMFANQAIKEQGWLESKRKPFLITTGALLGVLLILWITPESFMSFISAQELNMFGAQAAEGGSQASAVNAFLNDLEQVRISIFKSDAMRSLGFVLAGAVLLYLLMRGIVSKYAVIGVLVGLVLLDGWMVNKRYINNEKERGRYLQWEDKLAYEMPYAPTRADIEIAGMEIRKNPDIEASVAKSEDMLREMKKGLGVKKMALSESEQGIAALSAVNSQSNYRVLNLGNPFNDGRTPYFHKSIGGYHGAKLKRYQELIEFHLSPEIQAFGGVLQGQPNQFQIMMAFEDMKVLNMLNTRYVIYNPEAAPLTNPSAYGNAWFVSDVNIVANADEEITKLGEIEPLETALVDAKFSDYFAGTTIFETDTLAEVSLESYKPNELVYKVKSDFENFVVFSEIYYDAGWQAYLNGTTVDHVRANYVLRGMKVPAGENEVIFRFEPEAFGWSSNVATFSSLFMLLLVGFGFWREAKPKSTQNDL
jgi:hypothetical protein